MLSLFKKKPYSALIKKPIFAQCFVSIVVPVRDEAENLPKTLDSFVNQTDFKSSPLDPAIFEVFILVNNRCDNSAEIVGKWQKTNQKFNFHPQSIKISKSFLIPRQVKIRFCLPLLFFRIFCGKTTIFVGYKAN